MFRLTTLAAAVLALAYPPAHAGTLAIVTFAYGDTSYEPRDQATIHADLVHAFMQALAQDLSTKVGSVTMIACATPCTTLPSVPDALVDAVKARADWLLIGGFHKESTLLQWAKVILVDVRTQSAMLDKLYTFRGDNDQAWRHAEAFIAGDIGDALTTKSGTIARQVGAAPDIRIAVFPFEYSDFSADRGPDLTHQADQGYVQSVTEGVQQTLAESGRYIVLNSNDVSTDRPFYDCNGCDTAIALRLGADQSLVGVVRRISRTEYVIGFRVRDAHTGAVLNDEQSGLRIGADYSWKIGAAQLVRSRLLSGSK
jgi:hypothetical protein